MPPWQYGCVTAWGQAAVLFVSRRALPDTRMRRGALALLVSSVADRRLCSSRGMILGLYGKIDARAAGSKAPESLWVRSA